VRNEPQLKRQIGLKIEEWKMIFQANATQKQARLTILRCDKLDFKPKLGQRDKKKKVTLY
jgi:hypothetical protein